MDQDIRKNGWMVWFHFVEARPGLSWDGRFTRTEAWPHCEARWTTGGRPWPERLCNHIGRRCPGVALFTKPYLSADVAKSDCAEVLPSYRVRSNGPGVARCLQLVRILMQVANTARSCFEGGARRGRQVFQARVDCQPLALDSRTHVSRSVYFVLSPLPPHSLASALPPALPRFSFPPSATRADVRREDDAAEALTKNPLEVDWLRRSFIPPSLTKHAEDASTYLREVLPSCMASVMVGRRRARLRESTCATTLPVTMIMAVSTPSSCMGEGELPSILCTIRLVTNIDPVNANMACMQRRVPVAPRQTVSRGTGARNGTHGGHRAMRSRGEAPQDAHARNALELAGLNTNTNSCGALLPRTLTTRAEAANTSAGPGRI
ncbi:hypothetical protein B0H11DRAFT_1304371 [Mycena galericulata]|nr:hypothetical protein B0H11DRAFT_1304371 [Mycena galericulata]